MSTNAWLTRWEQGQTGWHQSEVNDHLQTWWPKLDLSAAASVLVPLCGASHDIHWLVERGHPTVGIDLSPIAAQQYFNNVESEPTHATGNGFEIQRADNLAFYIGDFFAFPDSQGPFSAVYDRAALIALDPQTRPLYAERITALTAPGSRQLLITIDYPSEQMQGPPYTVPPAEVQDLYGHAWEIDHVVAQASLDKAELLRERGLDRLQTHVFQMTRK